MDLVECEAPLDSSFQKDRLELVNKGSLGRRRKPSRSNLRLILSPANDRQDIFGFESNQHFDTEDSFVHQQKVTPSDVRNVVALDNQLKKVNKGYQHYTNSTNCQKRASYPSSCQENSVVSSNYREVVASINYIYNDKSIDLNGNKDHHLLVTSASKQRFIEDIDDKLVRKDQRQVKPENNNLNFKRNLNSKSNDVKNHQNANVKNHKENSKLDNVSYIKFKHNSFCNATTPKSTKSLESKSFQEEEICNELHNQQTVASKNRQNIITFSNRRQIVTSTPIHTKNQAVVNGISTAKYHELTISQNRLPKSQIESSLPRTSKEPDLVADAQQFSIEAKLRRKKSEGHQGRSAVLIQTWERRTISDSFSKIRRDSKSAPKNRFIQKEIFDGNTDAMPDSYICIKYKGSLQNGDNLLTGEVVRDVETNDTMLYRVLEDKNRPPQHVGTTNGAVISSNKKPVQEPEWISLSRKLCAKFVEGHIEPNSPDSYRQEEPEGVGVEFVPSLQPSNKNVTHSSTKVAPPTEIPKVKLTPTIPSKEVRTNGEPPWIHLSRKLCNKFIEEHIEFPPITNGHFVEVPELVEPNGDVRIIEKIGKSKDHKSKQKKECEPEWVSLSKKLRAKFIESHIDDPDTIALDNQLNVSDPEETGSETLSDISQETAVPKMVAKPLECKNFKVNSSTVRVKSPPQENEKSKPGISECSLFPEKECCWEYQEMEFDQESNSGNFQEFEICNEPPQETKIHRGSLPEDTSNGFEERITFENSYVADSLECYNNDVNFGPNTRGNDTISGNPQQSKTITVQFIAHTGKKNNKHEKGSNVLHNSNITRHGSFFNLSTWEEANYKCDDNNQQNTKDESPGKNFRSKSLDNLCDSLEETAFKEKENSHQNDTGNHLSRDDLDPSKNSLPRSEEDILQTESETLHHEFKTGFECASDVCYLEERDSHASDSIINVTEDKPTNWEEFEFQEEQNDMADAGASDTKNEKLSSVHLMAENSNWASESVFSETESNASDWNKYHHQEKKQNVYHARNADSSSEDEVFEDSSRNERLSSNSSERALYGKICSRNNSLTEKKKHINEEQVSNEKVKSDQSIKNCKNIKCNGVIPNSIYNDFPDNKISSSKFNQKENARQNSPKEPVKMGMSKWITMSKSEQNISKPEYSNVQSSILGDQRQRVTHSEKEMGSKNKSKQNNKESKKKNESNSVSELSPKNSSSKYDNSYSPDFNKCNGHSSRSVKAKESDLKTKCKSMFDISKNNTTQDLNFRQHESEADLFSAAQTPSSRSRIEFQHFEFDSEIPLCAKLVSKHDKKKFSKSIPSALPTYRTESPCASESSHLYEDMFKETPSGPSDSEASSWTAMKNNTYYINGRSSSMNDLDLSDSCSLSMKCDYASSSENSTLQSRHSSYASSSFYVNLRDYDSHMLEPSKDKRNDRMKTGINSSINASKSNPPTPESLRHLFTSPLNSAPSRTTKLLNRMPSDPQSHYYSTAAVTSSAFKHGFASTSPKQKKTERSSSLKIKDIAHGIMLTFKRFQNGSKNLSLSSSQVDVSHLAEMKSNSELGITKKYSKNSKKQNRDKDYCAENAKTDPDSGFLSDVQRAKARRSSSDLTGMKPHSDLFHSDKKKDKHSKKINNRDKAKKNKSKASETRTVPTVSRKVQQMADGTLYLVTTVSGDTSLPGVYSDSPDSSSELSGHKPFRLPEESNC